MKKVIVTGANGFVGSAVCRELVRRGMNVIAVVRDKTSAVDNIKNLPNLEIVYLGLSSMREMDLLTGIKDCDIFYHFAWTGSAGSLRGDYSVQLKNVEYTCDAVAVAKRMGCRRFVFAASIMEYEVKKIMDASMSVHISTIYSSAKIAAEYMGKAIADKVGIEYVGGIISNIYGPGEKSPRLVNTTIRKLLLGQPCAFSPGEQMYDFIYIDDAAIAFYHLGTSAISGKSYYIGSLEPKPLKEFLLIIRDEVSCESDMGFGEIPFTGISLTYEEFDIYALSRDTGFIPKTEFREGIRKTANWIKEHL